MFQAHSNLRFCIRYSGSWFSVLVFVRLGRKVRLIQRQNLLTIFKSGPNISFITDVEIFQKFYWPDWFGDVSKLTLSHFKILTNYLNLILVIFVLDLNNCILSSSQVPDWKFDNTIIYYLNIKVSARQGVWFLHSDRHNFTSDG